MSDYISKGRLSIDQQLYNFIEQQALPGSEVSSQQFWQSFTDICRELIPQNQALLAKREKLQQQIDTYSRNHPVFALAPYKAFLQSIGYLQPQVDNFTISTAKVDAEIASCAGPQLVVPINNARYALNAANARWGSLYDALYGTDVLSEEHGAEKGSSYNPVRGQKVVASAREWLDLIAPLQQGSHADAITYQINQGELTIRLTNQTQTTLACPDQYMGYRGELPSPQAILLRHHGLHAEIQFDPSHPVGKTDPAGIKDVLLESALTTIMDCEDSVAAVDAEDKILVYQNWLGLIQGSLAIKFNKGDKTLTRTMEPDRHYISAKGEKLTLAGRALMFVRNVGHLMTSDAILFDGEEVPEGIMDGLITSLIGKHDLLGNGQLRNSREGSIYIVKPKMHGPEEVAFANTLFCRIEDGLNIARNTIKMGIMDEERRTSVNLKACIHAAKERVVFINTGFLDRTGDEIHTSMLQGPFAAKGALKNRAWIQAYEKANVITGLTTGMSGKAQIGKGMWPIPEQMASMLQDKIAHPKAGANTAWVPSPTAATLHALHYHQVDVFDVQQQLATDNVDPIDDILSIPLLEPDSSLSAAQIQRELENNVQGILGYVVRWVHQGIGCSKVPDINNIGLMEDRATLRISSQHIANWLEHGIVTNAQVEETLQRMASLVDKQNADDPQYIPMTPEPQLAIGYQAARDLIFKGKQQPSGYTEPLLHARRRQMKAMQADNKH